MSEIKKKRVTPRQKMINLMYVVLMAMLALNVSSDVLKGFQLVEESLSRSSDNVTLVNQALMENFDKELAKDPEKVHDSYAKAKNVHTEADKLYFFIETLKQEIADASDGEGADIHNLKHADDLEAASNVMLGAGKKRGEQLYKAINKYRENLRKVAALDGSRWRTISDNLSTDVPKGNMGKNWQEYMFEGMPSAAAITMLTKMQNDVRYAEGEVLHSIAATIGVRDTLNMGEGHEPPKEEEEKKQKEEEKKVEEEQHHGKVGDIPVNELTAYVIPESRTVVAGGKYSAEIIMAAVDKDHRPTVYVGGHSISGSHYEATCNTPGEFTLSGYIMMPDAAGQMLKREFTEKYTVVAPGATVSADLMNVLYAGYENPVSISVPGIPSSRISASLSGGGSMSGGGGHYIVKPSTPGSTVTIVVSADGTEMGKYTFRVRKLPDPKAFIVMGGDNFFGGRTSKGAVLGASRVGAALDDGILHIPFTVNSFDMVFHDKSGNAVTRSSAGGSISESQRAVIREEVRPGTFFVVTHVVATGPDGITRTLKGAIDVRL